MKAFLSLLLFLFIISGCNENQNYMGKEFVGEAGERPVLPSVKAFESNLQHKKTSLYILKNAFLRIAITNYGGRIVSILLPDSSGKITDIVLGFNNISDYTKSHGQYFGAIIGRYANRIDSGRFVLNDTVYQTTLNENSSCYNGGETGFSDVVWDAQQTNDTTLKLSYLSKDMEEGFPGNLQVQVIYSLTGKSLKIDYRAITDKETVLNLTNQTCFNLNGIGSGEITDHLLSINAKSYLPVDSALLPTGEILTVANTPFDFRKPKKIGQDLDDSSAQLQYANGYNHNFVINGVIDGRINRMASITGNTSQITLTVFSDQPGLQFYSGNDFKGDLRLKQKATDGFRTGFSLLPQHFPNSPNEPSFPSTVLIPGNEFSSTTIYEFGIK